MRTLIGLAIAAALFAINSPTPAQAQLGEASSAFRAVVGEAQRLLRSRRGTRRSKFRSMVAADGSIIIPPSPLPNPRRTTAQSRRAGAAQPAAATKAKTASPKDTEKTAAVTPEAEQPAPKPDIWTAAQIEQAARACRKVLGKVKADLEPVSPIKNGPCGAAAPFKLASLTAHHRVAFHPAPVLNCKMVAALDTWLRRGLQPLAKKHLGAPIVRVNVMSSYSCRNAYGRTKTRLSEHALANALDIGGFVTANGEKTNLLAHWGPTQRDLIAQAEKEKARREAEQRRLAERKLAEDKAALNPSQSPGLTATSPPNTNRGVAQKAPPTLSTSANPAPLERQSILPPVPERRPSLHKRLQWAKAEQTKLAKQRARDSRATYRKRLNEFLLDPRSNLGGPKPAAAAATTTKPKAKPAVDRAAFLRGAHRSACRIFGTVLGPEANEAHRNHFHVDLAYRRRNNYCR